jgi:hypothetical protein
MPDEDLIPDRNVITLAPFLTTLERLRLPEFRGLTVGFACLAGSVALALEIRDRFLWSAAMIVTTSSFVWLISLIGPRNQYGWPGYELFDGYIDYGVVTGTIAYGALHFALARRGRGAVYAGLAVVTLAALYAIPLALGAVSPVKALCSLMVSAGVWSIGVWIADRAGFDVYEIDEGTFQVSS